MGSTREFRGQNTKGEWFYGGISPNGNILYDDYDAKMGYIGWRELHPINKDTIGQFTGFYDCNRKEIYEDDILQEKNFLQLKYKVEMFEGCWTAFTDFSMEYLNDLLENTKVEIIGNTHDNPELLDGDGNVRNY